MTIALTIKNLRLQNNWTQTELANRAGLTSAAISMIEKGNRNLTMESAKKLSSALGIELKVLSQEKELPDRDELNHFYNKFKGILELDFSDQNLIMKLVRRLQENDGQDICVQLK